MGSMAARFPVIGKMAGFGSKTAAIGLAAGGALTGLMPGMEKYLVRESGFYQAGLYSGGAGTQGDLAANTRRLLGRGMTAVGSDATVAAILSGRGVATSSPLYNSLVRQVSNAATVMNMGNEVAAQSMEAMTSGSMSANLLSRGIFTSNPMNGNTGNESQIFEQLARRWMVGSMTTAEIQDEIRRGFLGANISSLGLDPAAEERLKLYLISKGTDSGFKGVDFKSEDSMINWLSNAYGEGTKLQRAGFTNPLQPGYDIVGAETDSIEAFSASYGEGFEIAARALESMYEAVYSTTKNLGGFNALLSTILGNDLGRSITNPLGAAAILGLEGVDFIQSTMGATNPNYGIDPTFGSSELGSFANPVGSNWTVSAGFGKEGDQFAGGTHKGIDYAVPEGTPVRAAYAGVVKVADSNDNSSYGKFVRILHEGGYYTIYAHLSKVEVAVEDRVQQGQLIGYSGNTGSIASGTGNSTGAHLHFEVKDSAGNSVNPATFNPGGITGVTPWSPTASSSSSTSAVGTSMVSSSAQSSGFQSTSIPMGNTITINVTLANASQEETMRLVNIVREQLATDSMVSAMGAA
jgi:murein DD-endopeptidase MepM/ murein hydrolase activator NlpD